MSWSRDLSITWSRHMTTHIIWSHDPNTRSMNFILTSRYHRFQLPRHHSPRHQVIIDSNIHATISPSWLRPSLFHRSTHFQPIVDPEPVLRGFTSRSTPIQDPVVVTWEGVSLIAINESHWWEPRWVVSSTASWTQLARPSRTSTSASTIHHTTQWVGVKAE